MKWFRMQIISILIGTAIAVYLDNGFYTFGWLVGLIYALIAQQSTKEDCRTYKMQTMEDYPS